MRRREMGKGTVAVGSVANKAERQKEVELPNAAIINMSDYYTKQHNTKQTNRIINLSFKMDESRKLLK
jgi:hypothetical protein